MPKTWLPRCSALAFSIFLPWFPILPPQVPEVEQIAVAAPASEEPVVLPGVVIEEIPKGSALEKAGLQVGDVILSWERLPNPPANPEETKGELTSYFDWLELEVEQVPRGVVLLRGRRGGEPLELRVEPGIWEAKVRPVLSPALEEIYLAGKAQFASGDIEAAVGAWQSLADGSEGEDRRDSRAWIMLRIGDSWGDKREWGKAIEWYQGALEVAKDSLTEIAAWEALGDGHEKQREYEAAGKAFSTAFTLRQKLHPVSLAIARCLHNQGVVSVGSGELNHANEFFLRALELGEQFAPVSYGVAASLANLGAVAQRREDLARAKNYYLRALRTYEQLPPKNPQMVRVLEAVGLVAHDQGDLGQASSYYTQALQIHEQLASQSLEVARNLNNLGTVAQDQGDLDLAAEYHLRALQIRNQLAPQSRDVAISLNNLGNIALERRELDRAQDYHFQALQIRTNLAPESLAMASSLTNLGLLSLDRGDFDRAHDYLLRALEIKGRFGEQRLAMASGLNNLGLVAQARGELDRAETYYLRALQIIGSIAPGSLREAFYLNNLGSIAYDRGDLDRSHHYILRALQIKERYAPQSLTVASSLNNLGELAWDRKDLAQAQSYHMQALRIREQLAPQSFDVAESLNYLGGVALARGEPARACDYYLRALAALEHQLSKLGGSYNVQAGFRTQRRGYYQDVLNLFFGQGRSADAFHAVERYRAHTFLAMLVERDTIFTADIPEELDRERRRFGVRHGRALKKLADLNSYDNREEIEAARKELQRLEAEAGEIEARIRRASPKLAALKYPHPLEATETQQALDPGTLLLSYSVDKEKTALFVLSLSGDLEVKILPVGEAALRFQVKQLLSLIREASQSSSLGALRQRRVQAASRELYTVLLAQVEERIAASERLLILPDGPLHALPFGVLVRDAGTIGGGVNGGQYLAEWKPLHVALSATVFAELKQRRRPSSGNDASQAPIQLAAFGDPVYPQSLTKPKGVSVAALPTATGVMAQGHALHGDPVVRSAVERDIFDWRLLPYTRHEVEGIARLFPAGTARTYVGPEALEERIKSLDPKTRILHLAAHGHTDEHLPSSSFVALTIPEDTNPDADSPDRDNGLLQVWEIFEKVRLDADLVVLSACETALGEEQGGEGLIGLTRAFQYAGARTVMASLWSVQDQATSELMIRFYKHLRAGLPKDEALRQAQIELIRGPIEVVNEKGEKTLLDASSPYFWAGFQLYGDWQ